MKSFYNKYNLASVLVGVLFSSLIFFDVLPHLSLSIIEKIFVFAPLVIVPLGLNLFLEEDRNGRVSRLLKAVLISQPFCAIAAAASFVLPKGMVAGILASVWFAWIIAAALHGFLRLVLLRLALWEEIDRKSTRLNSSH